MPGNLVILKFVFKLEYNESDFHLEIPMFVMYFCPNLELPDTLITLFSILEIPSFFHLTITSSVVEVSKYFLFFSM